jgi:hypothetical protein
MEEEGEGKKWKTAERGENDVHDDKTEDYDWNKRSM